MCIPDIAFYDLHYKLEQKDISNRKLKINDQ